ncbi:MAG TPA: hypothetical protein VFQ20_03485 [Burkholderiaceae bacterium]|nr:hypothetical protein [Burkholderiaceae bacterium]
MNEERVLRRPVHALRAVSRRRWPVAVLAALATLHALPGYAQGEAQRIDELERRLVRSLELIERLSARVRQLEAGERAPGERPAPLATAASVPAASAAGPSAAAPIAAPAAPMSLAPDGAGLKLHGFADVGLVAASKRREVGAGVGSLDLYMTPQFGDRAKGLIELVFETHDGRLAVDLERLQLGYAFSDALTLWAGRFHTPFGNWNTAFHHGQQIQTAATRPRFLDFEDAGGVLPVHTIGAWGTGAAKLGAGRLRYDLYVGNAPTIELEDRDVAGSGVLDPGMGSARARAATLGANVGFAFGAGAPGLTLGALALRSKVADNATAPNRTRLQAHGLWTTFESDTWQLAGELYRFRNVQLGDGAVRSSSAWYLQAARTIGDWTPYARLERGDFDQRDAYFAQQASGDSYRRGVLGMRYELTPTMAVKLEANRTRLLDRGEGAYAELRSQIAVRF